MVFYLTDAEKTTGFTLHGVYTFKGHKLACLETKRVRAWETNLLASHSPNRFRKMPIYDRVWYSCLALVAL